MFYPPSWCTIRPVEPYLPDNKIAKKNIFQAFGFLKIKRLKIIFDKMNRIRLIFENNFILFIFLSEKLFEKFILKAVQVSGLGLIILLIGLVILDYFVISETENRMKYFVISETENRSVNNFSL